jgi:ribose 1,5-bisphosphokinase
MTWIAKVPEPQDSRRNPIGPGHLVLLIGPSGAGKDTILSLVRVATRDDERIVIPRRVITRAADGAEDHVSLSDAMFDRAVTDGAFAVWWSAHGNRYGIPVSAEDAIRAGRTVICNVSRTVVTSLRARYSDVTVVLVTAPTDVLKQRLAARQRSSDGDLAKRIARADAAALEIDPSIIVDNVEAPSVAAGKLLDMLRSHGIASVI